MAITDIADLSYFETEWLIKCIIVTLGICSSLLLLLVGTKCGSKWCSGVGSGPELGRVDVHSGFILSSPIGWGTPNIMKGGS